MTFHRGQTAECIGVEGKEVVEKSVIFRYAPLCPRVAKQSFGLSLVLRFLF